MKRKIIPFSLLILFLVLVVATAPVAAQQRVDRLNQLVVDIWPDYDRPAVLVLLTGRLPDETARPVQVTIPLPDDAELNAVARITDDNRMIDDVVYEVEDGQLTMTVPDPRFRIEYYVPYDEDGLVRDFAFRWNADLAIEQLNVSIQRPAQAIEFITAPASEIVGEGNDGLTYHDFLVEPLAAGETFAVEVNYELGSAELTAASAPAAPPAATQPDAPAGGEGMELNWPLLLAAAGLFLILGALAWHFWSNRAAAGPPPKPPVRRASSARPPSGKASFCHECGTEANPGDRFCRSCGTELKR